MINVERTLISQYANSPTIIQLVQNINEYIDPRANFDDFYDFVWNVDTAQGFGLDIWGRIVNIGRVLQIEEPLYFGFDEAIPGSYPFDEQPFYNGAGVTQAYVLADDAYRKLILAKALANITATNAAALNQLLQNMFADRGRCYVNDLGSMTMRYTFEFLLASVEKAIVKNSGVLPRPAGVLVNVLEMPMPVFGFAEAGGGVSPFDEGTFLAEGAYYAIS